MGASEWIALAVVLIPAVIGAEMAVVAAIRLRTPQARRWAWISAVSFPVGAFATVVLAVLLVRLMWQADLGMAMLLFLMPMAIVSICTALYFPVVMVFLLVLLIRALRAHDDLKQLRMSIAAAMIAASAVVPGVGWIWIPFLGVLAFRDIRAVQTPGKGLKNFLLLAAPLGIFAVTLALVVCGVGVFVLNSVQ